MYIHSQLHDKDNQLLCINRVVLHQAPLQTNA